MNRSRDYARGLIRITVALTAILASGCTDGEAPRNHILSDQSILIIPDPASVERLPGEFLLSAGTRIVAADDAGLRTAAHLNKVLADNCGFELEVTAAPDAPNSIRLSTMSPHEVSNPEAYSMLIEPEQIRISGSEHGLFYAVQSFAMLLPTEPKIVTAIPGAYIQDTPRFRYRGMHLDVARHFMPVDFVKKYIGLISQYKFNYFHLHLTDDQGWRIEIKKYPKLTEIGAKRTETVIEKNYRPYKGDGKPVEGFYTQSEIREIVEFAKARYVTVIPEIDLPGHSSAALAAYPQLGCAQNYRYKVKTTWGGFPDVFCPSEESFQFLKEVIDEVIELFPESPYLHIGGDEVDPQHWDSSALVDKLRETQKLNSPQDVQAWFLGRIEEHVNFRGKKIIGWDEILDGKLSPEATVMSWRGLESGIRSARSKRPTIICAGSSLYFDHPQDRPELEPLALGRPITLRNVYEFEPVPAVLTADESQYIIGAQGCVWTEFIKQPRDVEYMSFPRAIALAEVLWTPAGKRNYRGFLTRLTSELSKLDRVKVNYRVPEPVDLETNMGQSIRSRH
jgi:hexosaminidase